MPLFRRALDEMNLVEIPFAVTGKRTNRHVLELAPDGSTRLVADHDVAGLPTALGERVMIALLWYHNTTYPGQARFRLHFQHFVRSFLYPHRAYKPNSKELRDVEEQ